jgi:hypothetical protein
VSLAALIRRVALSAIALAAIGGATFGLAVAGGHLHFANARPSLGVKRAPASTLSISGLAPADTVQRVTVLQNRSRRTISRIRFELVEKSAVAGGRVVPAPAGKATPPGFQWVKSCTVGQRGKKRIRRCRTALRPAPSLLVTDPDGLRVTVDACPRPWRLIAGAAPTYTCAKLPRVLVAQARVPVRKVMKRLGKVKPGGKLYLRMTITLPASAGNALQGQSTVLVPTYVVPGGAR